MNNEQVDFLIGFGVGLLTWPAVGAFSVIVALLTAALWWAAGQGVMETKLWRIVGVPLTVTGTYTVAFGFHWWYGAALVCQMVWASVGWSVPDVNQTKASWLGTWWWHTLQPNRWLTDVATKLTWLAIFVMTLMPLAIR